MERAVSKIPTKVPISKSKESQKGRSKSVDSKILKVKMASHNNPGENTRYGFDSYRNQAQQPKQHQRKPTLGRDSYTALQESPDPKSEFSRVFKRDNKPEFEKDFGPFGTTVLRDIEQNNPDEDISTMFQRSDIITNPRAQQRPATTPGNSWLSKDHSGGGYQNDSSREHKKSRLPAATPRATAYGYTAKDLDEILAKYKNNASPNHENGSPTYGFNKYENVDPDFSTQEYPFHKNAACKNEMIVAPAVANIPGLGYPSQIKTHNTRNDSPYGRPFEFRPEENYKTSSKHTFPFKETVDGKLVILPEQVAFESRKISVLVADPAKIGSIRAEKVLGPREQDHVIQQVEEVLQRSLSHGFSKDANFNQSKYDAYSNSVPSTGQQGWKTTFLEPDEYQGKEIMAVKYSDATQGTGKLMVDIHQRLKSGTNADTHVFIGNKVFPVHSIALEVYSNFFDRLARPRETIRKIDLPEEEISPEIFPTLMNWVVQNDEGRDMTMNKSNVIALFSCGQFLDIPELKGQCVNFLHEKVETNDRQLMQLWDEVKKRRNCQELMAVISSKAAASFQQIYKSRQFLNLDVDEIVMLLSSDDIVIESELDAYDTAIRWLLHIWSDRQIHTNQIMSTIRFGLLTPLQLTQIAHCPDYSKGNNAQEYAQVLAYGSVKSMIDDGLAYSIVAESYKDQPDELRHWIESTGIKAPRPRTHLNFSSKSKSFNYHKESVQSLQREDMSSSRLGSKPIDRNPSYTIFRGIPEDNSSKSILMDSSRSRSRRSVADNFDEERSRQAENERSRSRSQPPSRSQNISSGRSKTPERMGLSHKDFSRTGNDQSHSHSVETKASSNLEQVADMLGQPIKDEDIAHVLTGSTNSSTSNKDKSKHPSWHH